ncbi:uncharacterized protein N0V89_011810 [Didymosphaeria variabile]|uniref:Uncharacterized protein n=1 Tax=Didymosphaeria variabile TaxID=1932322 RepID=A0A9W9C5Q4_9PLEO|nr:uncharacterized protein N0V89_011810 [Didymosphaeria variabile]KAJ4345675.1 hypothetical protein N0V89_011810 [Didymosphaeria variabile]
MSAEPENEGDEATFFWAVRPWATKNFAAVCEGNIFSILFPLDYIIRSFEFAPIDGAVCLDAPAYPPQSTYAERLFSTRLHTLQDLPPRSRRFVQFDVKSTTGLEAGAQHSVTGLRQHLRTAFYLVLCASDPGFISLIPNVPATRRSRTNEHHFAISSTRSLPVRGVSYGYLDPEHAAHRMPIGLLATAVQRVRDCALDKKDYVNPWTGLVYAGWEPAITESLDDLWPHEDTEHYMACLGTLTLWRELRLAREDGGEEDDVRFDMVGLQPRLADMKISFQQQQWLVQCKSDVRPRRPGRLGNVPIARPAQGGSNGEAQCSLKHYFASHDRFDFLLYDLRFDDGKNPPVVAFFFLPERVLPDAFFATCKDTEVSFDRADFLPYYMTVGENGDWGRHILDIIEANPEPRRRAARPYRDCVLQRPLTRKIVARLERLQRPRVAGLAPKPPVSSLVVSHRRLFAGVLDQCAKRRSGLLVVFAHNHAACDFGFAPYAWTDADRETYLATGRPPAAIHDLPAAMPMVPVYLFARDMECDWRGPLLSGAEFRRVNSWSPPRLLVFDAIAADDASFTGPLFVVPTADLSFTARHQQEYARHVKVDKKNGDRHGRVPLVRELLHSGRNIADYVLPKHGPTMYEGSDDWAELWTLLTKFTGVAPFTYPGTCPRVPADYRTTLQQLHARWWEEARRRAQDAVPLPGPDAVRPSMP